MLDAQRLREMPGATDSVASSLPLRYRFHVVPSKVAAA
jgi:hypothetical protein